MEEKSKHSHTTFLLNFQMPNPFWFNCKIEATEVYLIDSPDPINCVDQGELWILLANHINSHIMFKWIITVWVIIDQSIWSPGQMDQITQNQGFLLEQEKLFLVHHSSQLLLSHFLLRYRWPIFSGFWNISSAPSYSRQLLGGSTSFDLLPIADSFCLRWLNLVLLLFELIWQSVTFSWWISLALSNSSMLWTTS